MRLRGTGVIVHIPHASVVIPPDIRQSILFTDNELSREILLMTDHYTDELPLAPDLARVIKAPVSRLVVDVERFRCDSDEEMAKVGMGAVYTKTHDGKNLRRLTEESREALLTRYYDPHHQKLTDATREELEEHGRCLIIDVHSFSDTPLPHEPDRSVPRPDICLGTHRYHTPRNLYNKARAFFEQRQFLVKENSPFPGTMVPLEFYKKEKNIYSIMIETNRKWLSAAETGARSPDAERMLTILGDWIVEASSWLLGSRFS
ncbi:MAG: N-formylglutamate amidohydrolase [Planctomycetes bacterium]|nr:N-formylglutamate amidohydrolase [Planctomycetota bacterium]